MKSFREFITESNTKNFSIRRFDELIEKTSTCVIDGYEVHASVLSSIKRFYENTNPYNRAKVVGMINNSIRNVEKVHKLVLDYEKIKSQGY